MTAPIDSTEPHDDAPRHWLAEGSHNNAQDDFVAPVQKPSNKNRNIVIASIAGVVLAGAIGWAIGSAGQAARPVASPSTSVDSTTTPSPSSSERASSSQFVGEVLVQDKTVAEMDKMDIKTFANLSYADHLAYALDKLPGSAQAYKNVTLDFILQHPDYIPGYFWNGIRAEAVAQSDPIVGAKIAAAELYYTVDNQGNLNAAYQARVNDIEQAGGSHTLGNLIKYVSSTEFKPGVDTNGKPINVMDMTTYDTNPQTGAKLGPETTVQVFEVQIKLSNGTVVPFYPQGYGVN